MPRIGERVKPLNPFSDSLYWQTTDEESIRLYLGDVIDVLKRMPAQSVQCVVTSPPYWGLRDYGTAQWEGGDSSCDHKHEKRGDNPYLNGQGKPGGNTRWQGAKNHSTVKLGDACSKCGALRVDNQIGSEKTPQEFVAKMVDVFREVRRVLRDDGTLWLNLGDSYGWPPGRNDTDPVSIDGFTGSQGKYGSPSIKQEGSNNTRLKSGNLVGIPWRVALALQDDGWILRQDIIWHKPAPMPESVRNRCTKAHEYIFMLTKKMGYYCDMEAIKVNTKDPGTMEGRNLRIDQGEPSRYEEELKAEKSNKRSVWTVSSQGYEGAHFATFPPKLIEPCILAGCPVGGIVLDPFIGSGTTCVVSIENGRHSIGIDLSEKYLKNNAVVRIEGCLGSRPSLSHLIPRVPTPIPRLTGKVFR